MCILLTVKHPILPLTIIKAVHGKIHVVTLGPPNNQDLFPIPGSLTTWHLQSSLYPDSGPADYYYGGPCLGCIKTLFYLEGLRCLGVCLGNYFYSCKKHTFTKKCVYNNQNINLLGKKVPEQEGGRWLREMVSSGRSRTGTHTNSHCLWHGAHPSPSHTSLRAERRWAGILPCLRDCWRLCRRGRAIFSKSVFTDKLTKLWWKTTHPRIFEQHKLALKIGKKNK